MITLFEIARNIFACIGIVCTVGFIAVAIDWLQTEQLKHPNE